MNVLMYQFKCPGQIYGNYNGIKNIHTNDNMSDEDTKNLAKRELKQEYGYENCSINLLIKYKLTIDSIKTYSDITKVPFSEKKKKEND
jgi:hypothetical protein